MAHTTRLINFTRDLKYSIVSASAPLTLTVQKSLCTVLTSFCLKNHCRAAPMCTAAFTESFSLFLRRGRCPHRPLRKNPAPHKFPHIAAKTRYFSTFPSKAQIPLFGFSHFSFRIMGQKCCFFVPSVNSADWNFTLCSHFTKLTCIICHRKIIVFCWLFCSTAYTR